jgi:hypothetical protein
MGTWATSLILSEQTKTVPTLRRVFVAVGLAPYLSGFLTLSAATHHVSLMSTNPFPPYATWDTAATNIQQAVDAAAGGDVVLVGNGVYGGGLEVTNALTILSVGGPQNAIIDSRRTNRCVSLADGASLTGFTLANGYHDGFGGGAYCASTNVYLTNCTMTGNSAIYGGGVYRGTLDHCTLTGNWARKYIPGCCWNGRDPGLPGLGGGAYGSTLKNCVLSGNSSENQGGGVESCELHGCVLTGNSATNNPNGRSFGPGTGGAASSSVLYHCTLTGNLADRDGGASGSTLNNCILYFNRAASGGTNYGPSCMLNYCCTTPLPDGGTGNIAKDPQLASLAHLSANSPCRGAGSAVYALGRDIDGESWAIPPSMGCDEYHPGEVSGALTVSLQANTPT